MSVLLACIVGLTLCYTTAGVSRLDSVFDGDDQPSCESLDTSLFSICHKHGYNRTLVPNYLGHTSQTEAGKLFSHFVRLIERGCSPHLSFFMCAVHAPVCFSQGDFEIDLKPCRNVCESARAKCDSWMRKYAKVRWDESYGGRLKCSRFPDIADSLCLPSSPREMERWAKATRQPPVKTGMYLLELSQLDKR